MSPRATRFDYHSQLAKIARLYYLEQWPQKRIAQRYGMSVATVSRALARAREMGVVQIDVTDTDRPLQQLELTVETEFDLAEAIIVPAGEPGTSLHSPFAEAVAAILSRRTSRDSVVGVGWGETLGRLVPHVPFVGSLGSRVVPVVGAMGATDNVVYPNHIAREFAARLGGEAYMINGPAVFQSEDALALFREERHFQTAAALWQNIQLAVLGASGVDADSSMVRYGVITSEELAELRSGGAVCAFNFHFLDRDARVVRSSVGNRVLSASFDQMGDGVHKVVVAAGDAKVEPLRILFRAGLVQSLVTDEPTARKLLEPPS